MNIVTLNTWGSCGPWQKRWDYLVETLAALKPDLLFLQEVWGDALPDKIKKTFPRFHFLSAYEPGLVLCSKAPMRLYKIHRYEVSSPLESYDRGALLAETTFGSQNVILANTHLSWKAEDGATRMKQAEELLGLVGEAGLPAILAGDFNDVPASPVVQQIKKAGFRDLFERVGEGNGFTWDNANPFIQSHETQFPNRRIDFLFMDERLAEIYPPLSSRVVFNQPNREGIYPSDHYGVTAGLKI